MGYLTGITGGFEYLTKASRLLKTNAQPYTKAILVSLKKLIVEESPDIVFLSEVHDMPEIRELVGKYFTEIDIRSKYLAGDLMSRIPRVNKNANALFTKNGFTGKESYLHTGTKKLLYTVELAPAKVLVAGHFALTESARAEQFEEISRMFPRSELFVIGDLNLFGGIHELDRLCKKRNLRVFNNLSQPTFPVSRPRKAIDLLLGPTTTEGSVKVRSDIIDSDHFPIIGKIAL